MSSLLAVLFITLLFIGTAWYVSYFFPIISTAERIGLSFLLGSGLGTFIWYILYLLGFSLTFSSLILSCCLLTVVGMITSRHPMGKKKTVIEKWSGLDRLILLLIVIGLVSAFTIGSFNPITAWDSMALYDSRAHMIVLNHSLKDIVDSSYYLSYPLFVSLLHAAINFIGGDNPQGIHAIIFSAFLGIIYGRLRTWTNHRYALLGTFLNLTIYELLSHSTIAYANLAYTAFLLAGMFYAVSEDKKSHGQFLILSGLMLGLSTWVRMTEIFWVLGLALIFWRGYRLHRLPSFVYSLILFFVIKQGWAFYYASLVKSLAVPPLSPSSILSFETMRNIATNIPQILIYLKNNVIVPYFGFWGLATGVAIISFKLPTSRALTLTLLAVASFLVTAVGTTVYSTFFPSWFAIGDSVRRMLMFISPLTMTSAIIALYSLNKNKDVK